MDELPGAGLQRGQVGTIVEHLVPGVYEVEFSDNHGETGRLPLLLEWAGSPDSGHATSVASWQSRPGSRLESLHLTH